MLISGIDGKEDFNGKEQEKQGRVDSGCLLFTHQRNEYSLSEVSESIIVKEVPGIPDGMRRSSNSPSFVEGQYSQ
jgi:hypothetical protein